MKKHNIKIPVLTMTLCVSAALSGCVSSSTNAQEPEKVSTVEAFENNMVISPEEQAKAEKARRNEIEEQYSIYEPYGMTYDKENNRFSYNGQIVRCFIDQLSAENTRSFFFDGGIIDVESVRDVNGILAGLKQSSDADFKARTEEHDKLKAEFEAAGLTGDSDCFEMGDPDELADCLDAYVALGVSYDEASHIWMYDGRPIHIFYDAGYNTYCDNSVNSGINLKVIRDKKGNIEKLVESDAQGLEQYAN